MLQAQVMTGLWDLHPDGAYFRAQGGDEIPPPLVCNLGLTNKCNLRCEICGSQKHLDNTGIRRRPNGPYSTVVFRDPDNNQLEFAAPTPTDADS